MTTEITLHSRPIRAYRYKALLDEILADMERERRRDRLVARVLAVALWVSLAGVIVEAGILL